MTLSKVIDMAVGIAAIAVVAVLAKNQWSTPSGPESGPARENVVSTAETYPRFTNERATAVLIVSATCRFCEASLPFYKTLAEHSRRDGRFDVAVIVPTKDSSGALRAFFEKGGVGDVLWVEGMPPADISAVPAVVALDATGKVLASWIGKMNRAQEKALIDLFDQIQ